MDPFALKFYSLTPNNFSGNFGSMKYRAKFSRVNKASVLRPVSYFKGINLSTNLQRLYGFSELLLNFSLVM